jgi:hypothetical protein
VFAAFLERGFDRPTLRITLYDLFRGQAQISREQILVTLRTRAIMHVYPTYGNQGLPDAVPMACARDDFNVSGSAPLPGHREAWTERHLSYHRLGRGQGLAFHTRATHGPGRARWRRLVQRSITIKLAHQGEVLSVLMAKPCGLAGTVTGIAYEDEVSIRKPTHQARQQQAGQVHRRLMPRALHAIPLRGTVQGRQDGERPGPGGDRQFDKHRYDHPCMSPAIGGIAVR